MCLRPWVQMEALLLSVMRKMFLRAHLLLFFFSFYAVGWVRARLMVEPFCKKNLLY